MLIGLLVGSPQPFLRFRFFCPSADGAPLPDAGVAAPSVPEGRSAVAGVGASVAPALWPPVTRAVPLGVAASGGSVGAGVGSANRVLRFRVPASPAFLQRPGTYHLSISRHMPPRGTQVAQRAGSIAWRGTHSSPVIASPWAPPRPCQAVRNNNKRPGFRCR